MTNPNLIIRQVEVGPMANFIYLIGDAASAEVFAVDPAWETDAILDIAGKERFTIIGIILTHGHFDHCNGVAELLALKNMPVYINKTEAAFMRGFQGANGIFGVLPDKGLRELGNGESIHAGKTELRFLHTPGHSPGSQCILAGGALITGDTLFTGSIGRCDLPGSDPGNMYESLSEVIAKLPDDTSIYPGHNYSGKTSSSIGDEKNGNPYLACKSLDEFLKLVA